MDNADMFDSQMFSILKKSPLAQIDSAIEECAIWLDVNGMANPDEMLKVLEECISNYHKRNDIDWLSKATLYAITHMQFNNLNGQLASSPALCYVTDTILKKIFQLLFTTNHLDNCCSNDLFIDKIRNWREEAWKKTTYKDKEHFGVVRTNHHMADLYEVLAELVDRLEKKANTARKEVNSICNE